MKHVKHSYDIYMSRRIVWKCASGGDDIRSKSECPWGRAVHKRSDEGYPPKQDTEGAVWNTQGRARLRRSLLHAFLCGESTPGRRTRSESGGRLKLQLSSEQRVRRG